jgi:uncharacterized protein
MLIILSPAKKLDFKSPLGSTQWTQNRFLAQSAQVVEAMRNLGIDELGERMNLSKTLAELNFARYRDWNLPFTPQNARQAIFAFNGDAYQGLNVNALSDSDLEYAQDHLRILSALYGVIRPLDLIQPYRIEMAMKFSFDGFDSLYKFWHKSINEILRKDIKIQHDDVLINLASEEYFKVVDNQICKCRIITPVFKEYSNGQLKIVSQKAKRARGLMSRFIIKNRLTNPDDLKHFEEEGYFFSEKLSNEDVIAFTR